MIIKVRTTQTTEKEINIEFPFVTFDKLENKYYYNSDENKCMILNLNTGSILNLHYSNEGFEFEQIKKELTPKVEHLDKATKFIDYLKGQHNCEIVSVHVRRGDNMTNGQTGLIKAFESCGMYETYFNEAKKVFEGNNVKFLVFTGGQRFNEDNKIDVDWCRNFFKGGEFLFSEGNQQIDDFSLIMNCDHNILSHASSFGWWAAYVNPNPNKIVVAPEWYHPDEPTLKREKFYPKEYILK